MSCEKTAFLHEICMKMYQKWQLSAAIARAAEVARALYFPRTPHQRRREHGAKFRSARARSRSFYR